MPRWTRKSKRPQRFFGGQAKQGSTEHTESKHNDDNTNYNTVSESNISSVTTNLNDSFEFNEDLFDKVCPNLKFEKVKTFINDFELFKSDRFTALFSMYQIIAYLILHNSTEYKDSDNVADLNNTIREELETNYSEFFKVGHDKFNAMVVYNELAAYLWILYIESIKESLIDDKILKPIAPNTTPSVQTE